MIVNGKDDSPIEGATITIDNTTTRSTNENGNHCENHCQAVEAGREFPVRADQFCNATIRIEDDVEGRQEFLWAFLHPKVGEIF